jgi:hypothetical protein
MGIYDFWVRKITWTARSAIFTRVKWERGGGVRAAVAGIRSLHTMTDEDIEGTRRAMYVYGRRVLFRYSLVSGGGGCRPAA